MARRPFVLLVDDDLEITETFTRILSAEGFEVRAASSTEDGLREAVQRQPDVIMLEMRMPTLGGLGFLQRLRTDSHHADTVVAIVTSDYLVEEREIAAAGRLGASVHFKRLWLEDLVRSAHDLLDRGQPALGSRTMVLSG